MCACMQVCNPVCVPTTLALGNADLFWVSAQGFACPRFALTPQIGFTYEQPVMPKRANPQIKLRIAMPNPTCRV